ncbi:MAG: hypothetical protein A3E84_00245 [Gammaproteobacteria bacterium RIFCSPHIGHO2_12_FULL_42_13]|nr:MAG: hypothetical protein A3E84_00245 [Gammaproteobacteria bacterium RIFCSPHIGHO2_12_FULL_42_13]
MIKALLRAFLITLLILCALVAFLLTPTGFQFGVFVAEHTLPVKLRVEKIEGLIVGPMTLDNIYYQDEKQIVLIDHVELNWRPIYLLKGEWNITSLNVTGVHVVTKSSDTMNIPKTIASIRTTLSHLRDTKHALHITVQQSKFSDIHLINSEPEQKPVVISTITLSSIIDHQLNIDLSMQMQSPDPLSLQFTLSGKTSDYHIHANAVGHDTRWTLTGAGSETSLSLQTLQSQLLGGQAKLLLDWKKDPTQGWQGKGELHFDVQGNQLDTTFDFHDRWQMQAALKTESAIIRSAHLDVVGTDEKHTIKTDVKLPEAGINLLINGGFSKDIWTGNLSTLTVSLHRQVNFSLEKPAKLSLSDHAFSFEKICLAAPNAGNSCAQGMWSQDKIAITSETHFSQFRWVQLLFHHVHILSGKLDANLSITGTVKSPRIAGNLDLQNGSVFITHANLTLKNISAQLKGDGETAKLSVTAHSNNKPIQLLGEISLTHLPLSANFSLKMKEVQLLNSDEYSLFATTELDAKIQAPNILITGNIVIPTATIQPSDFEPTISLPTHDIVYIGKQGELIKAFWDIAMNINLRLGDKVNINASGVKARLSGDVQLKQNSGRDVFASGNVYIHDGTFSVYGKTLTLSHDSYLSYTNALLENPELFIKATKTIQEVRSAGGILPGMFRSNLEVGISLRGTVQAPKITFFSNQGDLSQADILSYILLGYKSSSNTPGNTDLMLHAVSAFNITSQGLLGKENIASQIQQGLGLSEMGVESETTVDALGNPLDSSSAFVVGKCLTKKLCLRVSVGIGYATETQPLTVYELRYLLNDRWALQLDSSSIGNGADVLYTIQRD